MGKRQMSMERVVCAKLPTKYGEFKIYGYENQITRAHHVALVMGEVDNLDPVLVRVHSECLTGDAFGSCKCDCGDQFDAAMRAIAREGRGVMVYLRQEGRGIGLINKLKAYALQDMGMDTVEANVALGFAPDERSYREGAEILSDLGIRDILLLTNNPEKIEGLSEHGLYILKRIPIETVVQEASVHYMKMKKEKMGHLL